MSKSDNIRVNLEAVRSAIKHFEEVERYPTEDTLMDSHIAFTVKMLKTLEECLGYMYVNTPSEPCVDGDADMFEN